jgi:hypothetical protein
MTASDLIASHSIFPLQIRGPSTHDKCRVWHPRQNFGNVSFVSPFCGGTLSPLRYCFAGAETIPARS